MKTYFCALLLLLAASGQALFGQSQIPDGDFENWASGGVGFYEEPASGWWSSLNPLRDLGGPVSVEKSSDAHTGSYSALLTTGQFGTLLVPGLLLSGDFNILNAPEYFTRGRDYSSRPTTFRGWYKYSPANSDSAAIAAQLTRWNNSTNQRDTVAETGIVITQAVSGWSQFAIPFLYYSTDTPDTLVVVATSSANAANFIGQVGSQLWIDDFDIDIVNAAGDPTAPLDLDFVQVENEWRLDAENERGVLEVVDLSGKILRSFPIHPGPNAFSSTGIPNGLYLLRFRSQDGGHWFRKIPLVR